MYSKTKQALILRVRRNLAGKILPFDKLYFFHTSMEPSIAHVFPFSLVLTLTSGFTEMIKQVVENTTSHDAFPLRRKDEQALKASFSAAAFADIFQNRAKYWAVVPTLYKSNTVKDAEGNEVIESQPAYICARPESRRSRKKRNRPAQDLTQAHQRVRMDKLQSVKSYLLVNGEAYRPICVACPNHMEVLNGRCFFGGDECYKHLSMTTPAAFVAGMKAYKQLMSTQTPEPELEELA